MTSSKGPDKPVKPAKQRIEEFRKELHQAELAETGGDTAAMMHNVAATGQGSEPKLGPTILAEVAVNRVPVQALINTGSPATIISLDFAMSVFAQGRKEGQTPSQWREKTLKKFSPPEVALNSYGGQQLSVIAKVSLCLSQGESCKDAAVLVQKGAPNNLLLGTDVQPHLGFAMVVKKIGGMLDLFSGRGCHCDGGECAQEKTSREQADTLSAGQGGCNDGEKTFPLGASGESGAGQLNTTPMAVVQLLQTTKIPAGYGKMVRARVDSEIERIVTVYIPQPWREVLS